VLKLQLREFEEIAFGRHARGPGERFSGIFIRPTSCSVNSAMVPLYRRPM
jgi:hypothetical protein